MSSLWLVKWNSQTQILAHAFCEGKSFYLFAFTSLNHRLSLAAIAIGSWYSSPSKVEDMHMEFEILYQDLAHGAEMIQALVLGVTQAEAQVRPTPESWSILEVICHLV